MIWSWRPTSWNARIGTRTLLLSTALSVACTMDSGPATDASLDGSGPAVEVQSDVIIQENDSVYLARPSFMSVGPSGQYFVTDNFHDLVHVIRPDGKIAFQVGQAGEGPGEFEGASLNFPIGDSLLVVWDSRDGSLNKFDQQSGQFIEEVKNPGFPRDAFATGETVWLGALDMTNGKGVLRWDLQSDTFESLVDVPRTYRESGALAGIFNGVMITGWNDGVLVAYSGDNALLVVARNGRITRRIEIPRARRRGVPKDIAEQMAQHREQPVLLRLLSHVRDLHVLDDGAVAVLHYDVSHDQESMRADVFMTILDKDLGRACVDGIVPTLGEGLPVAAFSGDTLHLLEQVVDSNTTRVDTHLRKLAIDRSECDWTELATTG